MDAKTGDILVTIRKRFMEGKRPSEEELDLLLKLCADPRERIREAALLLVLHPPLAHPLIHYRRLLRYLSKRVSKVSRLPPAIIEFLCDAAGFLGALPDEASLRDFFIRLLNHLPRSAIRLIFEKPYPLDPFLRCLPPRSLAWIPGASAFSFKRRRRLLQKRLLETTSQTPWARLTTSHLKPLLRSGRSAKQWNISEGRWRTVGRSLLFPPKEASAPSPLPHTSSVTRFYWEGRGNLSLHYMERLMYFQAEELRSVRQLACRISRKTRRVVLSWHNATLAAAGGWSFETLRQQFPSETLWKSFRETIQKSLSEAKRESYPSFKDLGELWVLREKRLFLPQVLHTLWESRIRAILGCNRGEVWRKDLMFAGSFLDWDVISKMLRSEKYGWHGVVSPFQRIVPEQILAWRQERQSLWHQGFFRLALLIREAQKLMDSGKLSHFVLPWIDKFFISSRREEDSDYLPSIIRWLENEGLDPLILFWEDTAHSRTPSFQLALERLHRQGCRYRGIGIYDRTGATKREKAEAIICRDHSDVRLFALRPCTDVHSFSSFQQLLETSDYRFFQTYDSSWKDNLAFLYAGTQVFPLLSIQCETELFSAWIASEHGKYPFGAYFRNRLRRKVLETKKSRTPADALSDCYALWANLC